MRAVPSPLIIGHRGASGYRPEHTSAAYELAFALGADAVEPDIVATRDGVLVLRHENDLSLTTDVASRPEFAGRRTTKRIDGAEVTGWFTEDFTWEELSTLRARERLGDLRTESMGFDGQYPILRLSELFALVDDAADAANRTLGIVAEIKHPTYYASIGLPLDELFSREAADAGWNAPDGRLTLECFEKTVLADLAGRGVLGKRVYLIEASGKPFDEVAARGTGARDYADVVTDAGLAALAAETGSGHIDGVSVDKSLILPAGRGGEATASDLVGRAHDVGLEAYCWTLRPENRFLAEPFQRGRAQDDFGDWRGEFDAIMATGVDGVFADHPDLAVAARSAR